MGSASAATAGWTVEDDVVLKRAVEAGASLESLAKGAVCFSHKFTLKELQDHWYSLLYDSETSAQASARMVEYETELLASNPVKASKLFDSKEKGFSVHKRKINSVKVQYFAMRKRVCHESCLSADYGNAVVPCLCVRKDGGGCACGCQLKCSEDHKFVHEVDPSGGSISIYGCGGSYANRHHVPSNGNGQHSFDTENAKSNGSIVIDGDSNHGNLKGCLDVDQLYRSDDMQKSSQTSERNIASTDNWSDLVNQSDFEATGSKALPIIDQDGVSHDQLSWNSTGALLEPGSFNAIRGTWRSQAHGIPSCTRILGISSPELTDVHNIKQETRMLSDGKVETNNNDALAFQENLDNGVSDSGSGNATVSAGRFMHSNLNGFSEEEDLELFSSVHVLDSTLDTNHEDVGDSHTKVFLKGISRGPHLPRAGTTNCGNHIDPIQKKHNVAGVYGVDTVPASSEPLYHGCDVQCILNTSDCAIPFNDHIPIPDESSLLPTSTLNQDSQHDMCLVPSTLINMENVVPSPLLSPPIKLEAVIEQQECVLGNFPAGMHCDFGSNNANMHMKALHSIDGGEETTCGLFQHECSDNLQNLTLDKSIQVPDQMKSQLLANKPKIHCEAAIQSHTMSHALPDTKFHSPIASMSTSGRAEGSDSENSIPDYVDIEALILEQDLMPWDQESDFIQPEVSRSRSPERRKDLMILEKGACSYMNRSIMSKGAFAIFYGQHLRYYIRDTEVTLGREKGEVHVDIDLAKEGKANKISRLQAVIKMDGVGSFCMKNIGKGSIYVNSKEVPCNKSILLTSDSLIEIRNLKFIFHVNHNAVRKHLLRAMRGSSQGNNTTFDWKENA